MKVIIEKMDSGYKASLVDNEACVWALGDSEDEALKNLGNRIYKFITDTIQYCNENDLRHS